MKRMTKLVLDYKNKDTKQEYAQRFSSSRDKAKIINAWLKTLESNNPAPKETKIKDELGQVYATKATF
jgi:hypothetical protein